MRVIQGFVLLVFLGIVLIFALQNTQALDIRFLNWRLTSTLSMILVGSYLLGMLSGWTVVAFVRRSLQGVTARRD